MTEAKKVMLKPLGEYSEGVAGAAGILPGMSIALQSDGKYAQATGVATSCPIVAIEDALQGNTINDPYVADDVIMFHTLQPGEEVAVILKDGESVAPGAAIAPEAGDTGLFVAGAGRLVSMETLAPSGTNGRLWCRVV